MKAIDVLTMQHREVLARFQQLAATDDPTERRRLLDEITDALEMHAELEEEVFYPALRESAEEAEALVLRAIEEHHLIDLMLAEAPDLDPEADGFDAKVALLRELVTRHIQAEERELFALASRLADDEAEDLGRRLEAETAWLH
jgi:hemerythrin superfamily protein